VTTVQRHSSGGPWEDAFGYSRAVRTGDRIIVSGCTAVRDGAAEHSDPAGQARSAFRTALEAVEALQGLVAQGVEGAIIGTALYEGRFSLEDALALTLPARLQRDRRR
jgi:enamine deaminase RidA (YjgF/YER057c/UK114 family)